MKKYILSAVVILCVVLAAMSATPRGAPVDTEATKEAVATAFGAKYNRPASDFLIEIQNDDGSFAKGSVRIQDEMGGALWFAAKTEKGWELAADGNGIVSCEIANGFKFPNDLIPTCIDAENENALVQR